jgi:hypothetical protein
VNELPHLGQSRRVANASLRARHIDRTFIKPAGAQLAVEGAIVQDSRRLRLSSSLRGVAAVADFLHADARVLNARHDCAFVHSLLRRMKGTMEGAKRARSCGGAGE